MVPRKKGSIIFIASIAGLRPDPLLGAYSGTINTDLRRDLQLTLPCTVTYNASYASFASTSICSLGIQNKDSRPSTSVEDRHAGLVSRHGR